MIRQLKRMYVKFCQCTPAVTSCGHAFIVFPSFATIPLKKANCSLSPQCPYTTITWKQHCKPYLNFNKSVLRHRFYCKYNAPRLLPCSLHSCSWVFMQLALIVARQTVSYLTHPTPSLPEMDVTHFAKEKPLRLSIGRGWGNVVIGGRQSKRSSKTFGNERDNEMIWKYNCQFNTCATNHTFSHDDTSFFMCW